MKRLLFLVLAVLTLYAAGMYRYFPLLLLFCMELFLMASMVLQVFYFKKKLTVQLEGTAGSAKREEEFWCRCKVLNMGKLPVGRFRLRVRYSYIQEGNSTVKRLYGGSDTGESELVFGIRPRYCGLVYLELEQLKVYDYLALFSASRSMDQEMAIAVFPATHPMHIRYSSSIWKEQQRDQQQISPEKGENRGEIRQLREYRQGDPRRHIHWNQSARTGKLWIKEFEEEVNAQVILTVAIYEKNWSNPVEMDAFYRLLSAVLRGFLENSLSICVYWYDCEKKMVCDMKVTEVSQCEELLLRLYQLSITEEDTEMGEEMLKNHEIWQDDCFRIDSELCWYQNNRLLVQFSRENLEQEIDSKEFIL